MQITRVIGLGQQGSYDELKLEVILTAPMLILTLLKTDNKILSGIHFSRLLN